MKQILLGAIVALSLCAALAWGYSCETICYWIGDTQVCQTQCY